MRFGLPTAVSYVKYIPWYQVYLSWNWSLLFHTSVDVLVLFTNPSILHLVHQVLFFRSKNDFEDWLMNPYVTKEERNNYVKLQIDFSSDVYRANVRGYKVTPVQLKDYGKNGMM
jgi:hypothetical protein